MGTNLHTETMDGLHLGIGNDHDFGLAGLMSTESTIYTYKGELNNLAKRTSWLGTCASPFCMLMIQFKGSQSDQLIVVSLGIDVFFRDFNSTVLFTNQF